jgi:hypothetical protein
MKKIKLISGLFGFVLIFALTFVSFSSVSEAASYGYINTSGNLVYVEANSFTDAFAKSSNIAMHSGVILVGYSNVFYPNIPQPNLGNITGYLYVNDSGVVTWVDANTSAGAFFGSVDIANHSGVMSVSSNSDANLIGDNTKGY